MYLRILAITCMALMSTAAFSSSESPEILEIKTIHVNGSDIDLAVTKNSKGEVCTQFVETIQMVAYGETVYTLGKRCDVAQPETTEI